MSDRVHYAEYLEDVQEYSRKGTVNSSVVSVRKTPADPRVFFAKSEACPFCKTCVSVVHRRYQHIYRGGADHHGHQTIVECLACGWWRCDELLDEEQDLMDDIDFYRNKRVRYAIARRYKTAPHEPAVAELTTAVARDHSRVYGVTPKQLEQIAQYVFSSIYNCNVLHVGQSHDRGIDLLVIDADEPLLVQVKRRTHPDSTESIATVRELIGTMFLENAKRGAVLSTARKFSSASKKSAAAILDARKFSTFELFDYQRFCDMLDIVVRRGGEDYKPWRKLAWD